MSKAKISVCCWLIVALICIPHKIAWSGTQDTPQNNFFNSCEDDIGDWNLVDPKGTRGYEVRWKRTNSTYSTPEDDREYMLKYVRIAVDLRLRDSDCSVRFHTYYAAPEVRMVSFLKFQATDLRLSVKITEDFHLGFSIIVSRNAIRAAVMEDFSECFLSDGTFDQLCKDAVYDWADTVSAFRVNDPETFEDEIYVTLANGNFYSYEGKRLND